MHRFTPSPPPRPLHRARAAGLALAALLALGLAPHVARAEDGPEQLRQRLLEGRTKGEHEGALKVILARPAEQVGAILGPLFSQPELDASVELLAATAELLAENPVGASGPGGRGGTVLLAAYIFRRAASDPIFVSKLRDALAVDPDTGQAPDWERLVDNAGGFLDAKAARPLADRLAAVGFLAYEDGARAGRVVDDLALYAKRLRDDATLPAEERQAEGATLLVAFEGLLAYRFASLDAALIGLEPTRGWSYTRRLKHFSRLKTEAALDRQLAVQHGREVIRRLETPAELSAALLGGHFPHPEHQRAILARAAEIKPRPGAPWEEFFASILANAAESDVVLLALDQLAESGFGGGPRDCCRGVAEALALRLARSAPRDPPEVRRRLTVALGDMAVLGPVAQQVSQVLARRVVAPEEVPELVELVRAVGRCGGAKVVDLKPFYDLTALTGLEPGGREALRVSVARSLGREGIRASDAAEAVVALRGILEGSGGFERAVLSKVREQAYRSLAAYPGDMVAAWLRRAAETTEVAAAPEALLALEALGQMLGSGEAGALHGADTLAAFLDASSERRDVDERRIEALKRLKDLPPGEAVPAEVRERVLSAVRRALETSSAEAVRVQGARTAADLADPRALALLTAWWREQPSAARGDLLRALLESVVRAGRDGDADVAEALAGVATTAGQENQAVEWADQVARSAQRSGPSRPLLLQAQAQALAARASTWPDDDAGKAQRVSDLGAARVVLTAVVQAARSNEEADPVRRRLVEVLERLAEVLGEGPTAADRYVEIVVQAARSSDHVVLRHGERVARLVLASEALRAHLSAERLADLGKQLDLVLARLEGQK